MYTINSSNVEDSYRKGKTEASTKRHKNSL